MKANRCKKIRLFAIANKFVAIIVLLFFGAQTAFAAPYGAQVVNGNVSINTQGNTLTVTNSPNSIINWQGFSIATNEAVRFIQQSSQSAVLNRIIGQNPSAILGALQSNGRVFLINPNGILFGQGAQINVNGLVASTLNLTNQDFLAGRYNFTDGALAGSIKNQGTITTPAGGKVYLIAPDIENSGIINSPKGDIILAAGHSVQLVDSFNPDISVVVSAPENKAVNLGQIMAESGRIGIYGGLIQQKGIVSADSAIVGENGKIYFKAQKDILLDQGSKTSAQGGGEIRILGGMDNGTVTVNGTLDASAPNGGDGGFIETSAAKVIVGDSAAITTLAPYGKTGTWLIDPTDFTIGVDITGGALGTQLNSANVTIETSSAGAQAGDITVANPVSWSTGNTLTLKAHNDISINAPITSTQVGGNLVLRADSDASGAGTVAFGGIVGQGGGSVNMGSGAVSIYYNPLNYTAYDADVTGFNSRVTATTRTYYMLVNDINNLQAVNTNLAGTYALGKSIDASATSTWNSNAGFVPLGDNNAPFSGIFDGKGNTITGLYINRPGTDYVGLFGYIGYDTAIVRNVGLMAGNITGNIGVGGLAGWNGLGSISDSYYTGSVSGNATVGGLVGANDWGSITRSYSAGTVTGTANVGGFVGIISGSGSTGSISYSYSTSAVAGNDAVGGLAGVIQGGIISGSYSTGAVSGSSHVGGLLGWVNGGGTISNSYWDTVTSGRATSAGGTGKTTAEMMTQAAYSNWDFGNTWWMSDTNTRPFLRSEYSTTINNAHQLQLVAMNLGASYTLANNIDLGPELAAVNGKYPGMWGAAGFVPLGNNSAPFTGTFDGLGRTITGLKIYRPATNYVGLFGFVGYYTGDVRNVGLIDVNVTGQNYVGGLAGMNYYLFGSISNSYNAGTVNGASYVGGLVGENQSSVSNSHSSGTVSGTSYVGGLAGFNNSVEGDATISNSYSAAAVTGTGNYTGGLVGFNEGIVTSSYATGAVTGNVDVGGLIGYNQALAIVTGSHATGAVSGGSAVGGLVGYNNSTPGDGGNNNGTISDSYATGAVSGIGENGSIGGLVGANAGLISNSYAAGAVNGSGSIGGLAGGNMGSITNSYSTGAVTGNESVGGLVGYNQGSITDSYSESVVSGNSAVGGLVGWNNSGSSTDSYSTGTVTGTGDYVGGLVGNNEGSSINSSYSTGAVNGQNNVGGLIGRDYGSSTSDSYSTGNVTGTDYVGGLVGYNDLSSTTSSYSTGAVNGQNNVGGLIGYNDGTISKSFSTGMVTGTDKVGGLVGSNPGGIINSYASGAVSGSNDVGGLVGYNYNSITKSFSTGAVTGATNVGGLVGEAVGGTIANSYWDKDTSGQTTSAGGTGKTTAQMKQQDTFAGWDFEGTWSISEGISYPYLQWQGSPPGFNFWSGYSDYYWNNALNWSMGWVPLTTDQVIINGGAAGSYTIIVPGTASAKSITSNENLTIAGGTLFLTAGNNSSIFGSGTNLSLTGSGAVNIGSGASLTAYNLTLTSGDISGPGSLTVSNGFSQASGGMVGNTTPVSSLTIKQASGDLGITDLLKASGNITLAAGNDLTTSGMVTTTTNGSITMAAGRSITIGNKVEANGSGNITLAANNVDSNETDAAGYSLSGTGGVGRTAGAASLTVDGAIVSGTGNIKLLNSSAGSNGGTTGDITLGANVSTHGGIVIESGGDVIQDAGSITNQLADPAAAGSNDISISGNNITLRSVGSQRDVTINASESLTIATASLNLTSLLGPLNFLDIDDEYFSYTLPFGFPFYGTTYTTVYISSNGMVTFAEPQQSGYPAGFGWSPYTSSLSGLADYKVIAAAWNDWMTSTTPLHDIYVYNISAGNVSGRGIRWDVYRFATESRTAQFEMQIFSNGNIKFNYGPASEAYGASTQGGEVTIGLAYQGSGPTIGSALMNLSNFSMNNLLSTTFTYNTGNYTETLSNQSNWIAANNTGNNSGGTSAPGGINAVRSVNISAANVINDNIDSSVKNITAQNLTLNTASGSGSGNALMTAVHNLSAVNTTANNIQIDNTGALTVAALSNGGTGDVILQNIGAITTGVPTVTSAGGSVSITAHSPLTIGSGGVSAVGDIALEAAASGGSDGLTINGNIASTNGSIALAAGSSIAVGPGATLTAPHGTIVLRDQLNSPSAPASSSVADSAVAANTNAANNTSNAFESATEAFAMVTTISEQDKKDEEELKKKKEGGEKKTDENKQDNKDKKYCN